MGLWILFTRNMDLFHRFDQCQRLHLNHPPADHASTNHACANHASSNHASANHASANHASTNYACADYATRAVRRVSSLGML